MDLVKFCIFIFFFIVSIFIILLVLIQDEQGDGIGGVFGGGSSSIFGAKSSSVAVKITGFFIALFFIFVILLSFMNTRRADNSFLNDIKTENKDSSTFWNNENNENNESDTNVNEIEEKNLKEK
ncbi:preprotein translocase subunit SecG [Borreliella valaisiana]|uniref:preprotein translocase subunit SecG n=1 Tax=Borreliella valaisiana TaxID=62088 RepID=UPI002ED5A0BB|nr:preprotein translocase subunit SecG [Borreliella valaisiana]WVN13808.1 preprotein translocase subunit SecG [Borreliella valaisiana]